MRIIKSILFLLIIGLVASSCTNSIKQNTIPHIIKNGDKKQLIVNNEPWLLLAGELNNSSSSSMEYMKPKWNKLKAMNLNTVLAAVSWELIEPKEDIFDFSIVDQLITGAREHEMKLVILWFGTWKNSGSTYPPIWVRQNTDRFPRVQMIDPQYIEKDPDAENLKVLMRIFPELEERDSKNLNIISPFSEKAKKADAKAFSRLMAHIKEVDGTENTVIAVQVENEIGVRKLPRDYCPLANEKFQEMVPERLMHFLQNNRERLIPEFLNIWAKSDFRTTGTWEEVFSTDASEIFMAWYYANYIEAVAAAGKKEYPLPIFVNAWLDNPTLPIPGSYPSGGPIAKMFPVYLAAAPSIDFLAPDIYRPDFAYVCQLFKRMDNMLFIPETGSGGDVHANAFYAFAEDAVCFSPFGIDNVGLEDSLKISKAYGLLSKLIPTILEYQSTGKMKGVLIPEGENQVFDFGNYKIKVEAFNNREIPAYGILIEQNEDTFMVIGEGFNTRFLLESTEFPNTEIEWAYELIYQNNEWKKGKRLNGDETGTGSDHNIMLKFDNTQPSVKIAKIFAYK